MLIWWIISSGLVSFLGLTTLFISQNPWGGKESFQKNCSIIVVGAGAAGMAATAKLLSHGFSNVTVLEASSKIGGRIDSIPFGPYTIDMGAQWVHGEKDNVVYKMASDADEVAGSLFSVVSMLCANSSGHIYDTNITSQLYTIFYRIHDEFGEEKGLQGSFGDYFIQKFNAELQKENIVISDELKQSFVENLHQFENSVDAADSWFETSAPGLQQYKECEGNPLIKWKKGGYSSVFKLIDKHYGLKGVATSSRVQLEKQVTDIEWEGSERGKGEVLVRCLDGSQLSADHVIVAVSLGVLKANAAALFRPQLPSYKQIAIRALGFGTVNKIFLRFPRRWWPEDCTGLTLLWTSLDRQSQEFEKRNLGWAKDVFGFFTLEDLPDVLCGWVVGKSGRLMELETDQTVLDVMAELLTRFFGNKFDIPKPTAIARSTWHSNPFIRGSYSFRTVDSQNVNATALQLSQPVANSHGKQVLFFAGEATHPHFYSTVHGAVETGLREADRIASIYSIEPTGHAQTTSVVVVGAGIAGLAACKTLIDQQITDIVLLEGQSDAGGRIRSVEIQDGGGWAELGAQWIHGEEANVVHRLANDRNLLSDRLSAEGLGRYLYVDGEEVDQRVVHEVEGAVGDILEECEKFYCSDDEDYGDEPPLSVGHYLCDKFQKYLDECQDPTHLRQTKMDLFDWHIRFQVIDNSCDNLDHLSAKFWGCYKFSGGRDYVNFRKGYSTLVDSLVQDLPPDMLKLNCPVARIILDSANCANDSSSSRHQGRTLCRRPVTVVCDNNVLYRTSHVIVTCSLGYLKRHHQTLFSPKLPAGLVKAIETMGFNVINKIFLIYEERWWREEDKGFQIIWKGKQHASLNHKEYWMRSLTGFDVVCNFDNVLLGWVGGEGAVEMEQLTEPEIGRHCTNLLSKMTRRNDLPSPIQVIRSQWHGNQFVCGGYSHTTSGCDRTSIGPESLQLPVYVESALSPQHPAILVAGEATHEKYFSTTHGAYESGERQANRIVSFMNEIKKAEVEESLK